MREKWLPVVGRIVWRSERHAADVPCSVRLGGALVQVEVVESWVEGPAIAGDPLVRVFAVLTADGRRLRLISDSLGAERIEAPLDELSR